MEEEIYLQMRMSKALGKDEDGNWLFDVEASNENLDLEGQRVLRDALLGSKDYFLANGVVSKDHRHERENESGGIDFDEKFVIGEPVAVYVGDDGNVRVKGKLYKSNEFARRFAQMLADGSTRIKASVGGIKPKIKKIVEGGREIGEIGSVLWNDLALTIAPVNPTVAPAHLCKSLSGAQFVKSLSAGHCTDSAAATGGEAIVSQDFGGKSKNDYKGEESEEVRKANFAAALLELAKGGATVGEDAARALAQENGIEWADAIEIIGGFGGDGESAAKFLQEALAMKKAQAKKTWEDCERELDEIRKSLGKSKAADDDEEIDGGDGEVDGEIEVDDEDFDGIGGDEDDNVDDEIDDEIDGEIDIDEDGGDEDDIEGRFSEIEKSIDDLRSVVEKSCRVQKSLMAEVAELAKEPMPRKSAEQTVQKSVGKSLRHSQFDAGSKGEALAILRKSVREGKLSGIDFTMAESQINKSIANPNFQIDQRFVKILHDAN